MIYNLNNQSERNLYAEGSNKQPSYPFEIGDDYYTVEDGKVIHSCWDDVSEEMYDPETKYFASEEEAQNFIKQNLKPIN